MASATKKATRTHFIKLKLPNGRKVTGATPTGVRSGDEVVYWTPKDANFLCRRQPSLLRSIDKGIYCTMTAEQKAQAVSTVCLGLPNREVYR